MVVALTVVVAILGVVVILTLGAVVELFRDIAALRKATGLEDAPRLVDIEMLRGVQLRDSGLLGGNVAASWVLLLSDKCGSCLALAQELGPTPPLEVAVVLIGGRGYPTEFLDLSGMAAERIVVDEYGDKCFRLGLTLTPMLLRLDVDTRATAGFVVGSARQLKQLLKSHAAAQPKPLSLAELNGPNSEALKTWVTSSSARVNGTLVDSESDHQSQGEREREDAPRT